MRKVAKVESIEPVGEYGFYQATLGLGNHAMCITIIGSDLTECVERTNAILQAFNGKREPA